MTAPPAIPAAKPTRLLPAPAIGAIVGLLAITILALRLEGRLWHCACGEFRPWSGDIWSSHCSQHFLDPYSVTHFSHGLIFFIAFYYLLPRVSFAWKLVLAVGIACAWEILENSSLIIERYRKVTMSQEYLGDSVTNSVGDILCCAAGFLVARKLGVLRSFLLFAATEIILLFVMRDNLTLNVIMLIHPLESIKHWQSVGH